LSPTPFTDGIDILKSDAAHWLLERYSLIVVFSAFFNSGMSLLEVRDKLEQFVEGGGTVIITAGSLGSLPGGLLGITTPALCNHLGCSSSGCRAFLAGTSITMNGGSGGAEAVIREPHAFELCAIGLPPNAMVLATAADGATAAAKLSVGRGKVVVLASPFAVTTNSVLPDGADSSDGYGWWIEHVNEAFPTSQPMLAHANRTIASALREHALFTVGDGDRSLADGQHDRQWRISPHDHESFTIRSAVPNCVRLRLDTLIRRGRPRTGVQVGAGVYPRRDRGRGGPQ
jgi:hypothetical protein